LSRQGLGVEETLKRTQAALILTRLSGLDAAASVAALTATMNSFQSATLEATEIVNKLANVDAAFAVSSADLANALSRVGSSADDAGISFDELIALVTTAQQITARGGAVIGNSLKTIFTRLGREKVQEVLYFLLNDYLTLKRNHSLKRQNQTNVLWRPCS
jgi:TP901 family phage tail tape measure protein